MNAIDLLKEQHKKVKTVLEAMSEGEKNSAAEITALANDLVAHMVIEEHVFYPRIKELKEDLVNESYEEHAVARFELARLIGASSTEEKKTFGTVLMELIEHHVKEEEEDLFPKVRKAIDAEELEALGAKMKTMFEKAVATGYSAYVVPSTELRGAAKTRAPNTSKGSPKGSPRAEMR